MEDLVGSQWAVSLDADVRRRMSGRYMPASDAAAADPAPETGARCLVPVSFVRAEHARGA